jgi:peptide chain release factor 1
MDPGSTKYVQHLKKISKLEPLVHTWNDMVEHKEMYEEWLEQDASSPLPLDYQIECEEVRQKFYSLQEALKDMLVKQQGGQDDITSVFLEVRAGSGGLEAGLFCAEVSQMYTNYCLSQGWDTSVVNVAFNDLKGGYRDITLKVEGDGVYTKLQYEAGVHRVQRVPTTESQGRIHTSTITVSILPSYSYDALSEEDITINPGDIRIDTMRSSGPGGQHVNKTDSAVRIVHLPTGVKVECQSGRSQHSNKEQAMQVLRARLLARKKQEQRDRVSQEKLQQTGTGARSERIRTYNYPQRRITDHRINKGFFKFDAILAGDLEPIIIELAEYFNGREISNL